MALDLFGLVGGPATLRALSRAKNGFPLPILSVVRGETAVCGISQIDVTSFLVFLSGLWSSWQLVPCRPTSTRQAFWSMFSYYSVDTCDGFQENDMLTVKFVGEGGTIEAWNMANPGPPRQSC